MGARCPCGSWVSRLNNAVSSSLALQIRTVLLSVQGLLSTPNPEDPLDEEVAKLWKENKKKALRLAKESTERYAKAKQQP